MDMVLPMNTGAEAVETAIKAARKWGYEVKGVPRRPREDDRLRGQLPRPHDDDRLFSDDPVARAGFGPFTPGFETVPFGDLEALEAAIDDDTVALPGRADPGRGGRHHPAGGLSAAARASSVTGRTC